jgi:hypothetical protein
VKSRGPWQASLVSVPGSTMTARAGRCVPQNAAIPPE